MILVNIRSLFVCGSLILFASVFYGAGSYQRTRDGQTLVWRDVPERGDEATWSGKRDKDGFATGSGVLTWYKVEPTIVTGSNILDTRRYMILINHYSGTMVRGKFKGAVTYVDAGGKRSQATSVNETNRPSRRKKATRTATPRVKATTPTVEPTPTPASEQIIVDTPELTSGPATSTPAPDQSPSPIAEEPEAAVPPEEAATSAAKGIAAPPEAAPEQSPSPSTEESQTAVPPQTDTLVAKRMASPPSEQHVRQPDTRSTTESKPTRSDDSLRSLSARPEIPKPPRTIDEQTVVRLDAVYQSAVKANDVAIMDEILADDFVLVTDRGASLMKADLIKEAQEKRTIYEHHEVEEGTQKVRIWRDTAVVTALLRIKGTKDQNPFDYKVWVSETYVRTPTGWRYVFGQSLKPDAK